MPSHFSSLGFRFESLDDFERFTEAVAKDAVTIHTKRGSYLRWTSFSGAELWLQMNKGGELIGAHPHYAGNSSVAVRLTRQIRRGDDTELDGAFHAWINP